MIKKAWLIIGALITLQTYGMEIELCFFANMPVDPMNRIGQILIESMESEKQFITRTQQEQKKHGILILPEPLNTHFPYDGNQLRSYCPSGTKMVILQPSKNKILFDSALTIVDLTKKKEEQAILYSKEILLNNCIRIALSSKATMIATIQSIPKTANLFSPETSTEKYDDFLVIQNLVTGRKRTIDMSKLKENYFCKIKSVAFNKQGTLIIIWGLASITFDNTHHSVLNIHGTPMELNNPTQFVNHHIIFPLTKAKKTENPVPETKNLLLDYFRQKLVCKDIHDR